MIRMYNADDFKEILSVINDGAAAYKGIIPQECWHEPYMPEEALKKDIELGVKFFVYEENGKIAGVMGIQDFPEVSLIRHAYTRASFQKKGIGAMLLKHLLKLSENPFLIGTWACTPWSIHFYTKHGFKVLPDEKARVLLSKYWPQATKKHRESSVVLADSRWLKTFGNTNV